MPTQVRITRVSLSSSQAPFHLNPGDVPDGQQHLGIQHRLSQVLLLQLQPQLLSPSLVVLLLLLLLLLLQPLVSCCKGSVFQRPLQSAVVL